jgi:site-specific DNA recombinase
MNNIIRSVVLCRVSSRDQSESGYSLDAQEKLLTDYSAKNDFKTIKVYKISESASGKQVRKLFNEILVFASKNKVDVILCEKIDRLTRNLKDAAIIDDWVKGGQNRSVHFVKENFILNQYTKAHENLVWDMKVAIARFYTNNLSEEVKKGQKEKLAQGWLPQRAKIGYIPAGEKGHIIHLPDPNKAPLIKKMFELYSTGNYPLTELTKTMKKEGLRNERSTPVSRTRMHELLSDPFYYGKNVWMGQVYDGKHEPIIDKDLFDSVQEKLSIKFGGKPKYRKHLSVFKAKMKCQECGGTISWQCQKGYWYGSCNHFKKCSQTIWVKQPDVEQQLFPLFDKVAPKDPVILEWLEKALKESHASEIDYNATKREELNRVIRTADLRIEGAYKDKLDRRMPAELCEKVIKTTTEEKEDAIDALNKLSKSRTAYYEAGFAIHELACKAQKIYQNEKVGVEDRRLLLSNVFANLNLDEGKITPNYTFAFEFLLNWVPKLNSTFELAKTASFKHKTEVDASVCTVVRGRWDLNPRSPP